VKLKRSVVIIRRTSNLISRHVVRLGSESLVSLLGVTVTFIALLLQIVPDRPLGSDAFHGIYDNCFYKQP
jgi:hypothetical protein